MKISMQEKIAELETRIAKLEAQRVTQTRTTVQSGWSAEADSHWRSAWKHFDKFFEGVFK